MSFDDGYQHDADECNSSVSVGHGPSTRKENIDDSAPFRRIEIITGTARRRTWPADFKAQVTAETFAPGANISAIARQYGVSIGLVHYWRKCARDSAMSDNTVSPFQFVSVMPELPASNRQPTAKGQAGSIGIEVNGTMIHLNGSFDEANLRKVLSVVRACS